MHGKCSTHLSSLSVGIIVLIMEAEVPLLVVNVTMMAQEAAGMVGVGIEMRLGTLTDR